MRPRHRFRSDCRGAKGQWTCTGPASGDRDRRPRSACAPFRRFLARVCARERDTSADFRTDFHPESGGSCSARSSVVGVIEDLDRRPRERRTSQCLCDSARSRLSKLARRGGRDHAGRTRPHDSRHRESSARRAGALLGFLAASRWLGRVRRSPHRPRRRSRDEDLSPSGCRADRRGTLDPVPPAGASLVAEQAGCSRWAPARGREVRRG